MPNKYELRCKKIPHKYLDEEGSVYGISWKNVEGKALDVSYIDYRSSEHTEENIRAVCVVGYMFAIYPESFVLHPAEMVKETAKIAKYTELWAVYPNYKRRVW